MATVQRVEQRSIIRCYALLDNSPIETLGKAYGKHVLSQKMCTSGTAPMRMAASQ